MFFRRALWMLGICMFFESFRRGFIGGSSLSLFIIKEFGLERQAVPTLAWLRRYVDIEEEFIAQIPPYFAWLITPITDYHLAAKTYLKILDGLSELQRPRTCEYYWQKE